MNAKGEAHSMRAQIKAEEPCSKRAHILSFGSVYGFEGGLIFPCDHMGAVDIDALSDADRISFQYAVSSVGQDFHDPLVLLLQ